MSVLLGITHDAVTNLSTFSSVSMRHIIQLAEFRKELAKIKSIIGKNEDHNMPA